MDALLQFYAGNLDPRTLELLQKADSFSSGIDRNCCRIGFEALGRSPILATEASHGRTAVPNRARIDNPDGRYRVAYLVADRIQETSWRYCFSARRNHVLLPSGHLHYHQRGDKHRAVAS